MAELRTPAMQSSVPHGCLPLGTKRPWSVRAKSADGKSIREDHGLARSPEDFRPWPTGRPLSESASRFLPKASVNDVIADVMGGIPFRHDVLRSHGSQDLQRKAQFMKSAAQAKTKVCHAMLARQIASRNASSCLSQRAESTLLQVHLLSAPRLSRSCFRRNRRRIFRGCRRFLTEADMSDSVTEPTHTWYGDATEGAQRARRTVEQTKRTLFPRAARQEHDAALCPSLSGRSSSLLRLRGRPQSAGAGSAHSPDRASRRKWCKPRQRNDDFPSNPPHQQTHQPRRTPLRKRLQRRPASWSKAAWWKATGDEFTI